ncbi:MAG: hypothetical protein ACM34J_03995 [Ignavibacteria bacterium]
MRIFKYLFLYLLVVFICSCNENIYEEQEGAWTGIIVPGKSIEGIKLGDSREDVVEKLGQPTTGGIADGLFRSWLASDYTEGPHAGLSIYYLELKDGSHGPVDIIAAGTFYTGKTNEGIGIGSTLKNVHKFYGEPLSSRTGTVMNPARTWIADNYCINQKHFEIHYEDSLITGFSIGYFLPPPDELNDCK